MSQEKKEPARSIDYNFSKGLPERLTYFGVSLMLTTYQAGKLMVIRAGKNGTLSTLLRNFERPMGIALDHCNLALGCRNQIWEFSNHSDIGAQPDDAHPIDIYFTPIRSHVTGDIQIHEMVWTNEGLVFVNTRFSCLCSLSSTHNFNPFWKPSFISEIKAEDRCHLNGIAIEKGRVRYVTAFGETNSKEGWRPGKTNNGIVIDVDSHQIITRGLSMPHSPRLYKDRLWILNSGLGQLQVIDIDTGKRQTIAVLPGFTRGLDFFGNYAVIGLSKIREKKSFGNLPIGQIGDDIKCAIAIVDIQTGKVADFIEFEDGCTEIFDVKVLLNYEYPSVVGLHKNTIDSLFVFTP